MDAISPNMSEDTRAAELLAGRIYRFAWAKVEGLLRTYETRDLRPGEYVQKVPYFENQSDYALFLDSLEVKDESEIRNFVASLSVVEYQAYVEALEFILKSKGYLIERVPITQHNFIKYLEIQEGGGQ